jgi:hypothetical protein
MEKILGAQLKISIPSQLRTLVPASSRPGQAFPIQNNFFWPCWLLMQSSLLHRLTAVLWAGTCWGCRHQAKRGPMPHEEETRLVAALTECQRVSRDAKSALSHPVHSMIYHSAAHMLLVQADTVARANYEVAILDLRAYRSAHK